MADVRFTVFTPVYNRRHTIHRVFDSLMRQTCMDFEWLVIDDGSTDNIKPLIDEYAQKAPFRVRYYYKENGGKHTATNFAYKHLKTEYFTILDSDDAFTDNAVEKMLEGWDAVPPEKREQYWGVVGHCVDAKDQKLIGELFPEGCNERDTPVKAIGDKTAALRTEVMIRYPYPEPKGTTFVTEEVVYKKIERDYKQYYINDVLKIVYLNEPDSLTVAWYRDHVDEGYISNFIWKQSILNDVGIHSKKELYSLFQYTFYGVVAKKKFGEIIGGLVRPMHKILAMLTFVPAKCAFWLRRIRAK